MVTIQLYMLHYIETIVILSEKKEKERNKWREKKKERKKENVQEMVLKQEGQIDPGIFT